MASVALLHDFSPDAFHGAIGPDRLILAGERRIVVAEHVLGTVVRPGRRGLGRAAARPVATTTTLCSAQDGRRNDIVQLGLLVLALLAGRSLGRRNSRSKSCRCWTRPLRPAPMVHPRPSGRASGNGWSVRCRSPGTSVLRPARRAEQVSRLLQDPRYGASRRCGTRSRPSARWRRSGWLCRRHLRSTRPRRRRPGRRMPAAPSSRGSWGANRSGVGRRRRPRSAQSPVAAAEDSSAATLARDVPGDRDADRTDGECVSGSAMFYRLSTTHRSRCPRHPRRWKPCSRRPADNPCPCNTDTRPAALPPATDSGGQAEGAARRAHGADKPATGGAFLSVAAQEGMRQDRLGKPAAGGMMNRERRSRRAGRGLLLLGALAVAARPGGDDENSEQQQARPSGCAARDSSAGQPVTEPVQAHACLCRKR